jgi:hypothetical protein
MEASEGEIAGESGRVATKGSTINVEGEAASASMITIGDLSSKAFSSGVGATTVNTNDERWKELKHKRTRRGEERSNRRRGNSKAV